MTAAHAPDPHTLATLRTLALASGGYATPGLNDCLYAGGAGLGWAVGGGAGAAYDDDEGCAAAAPSPSLLFPALALYSSLRALHLDRNGLAGDLAGWPSLPALAAIHLADNGLTSLAGLTPAAAPSLALLDVSGNRLTSLASLGGVASGLTCLRAGRNPLGGEEEEGEGDGEELSPSPSPSSPPSDPLAALHSASRLVTLDLADCGLRDGGALLVALRALPALRCLAVAGNPGADVAAAFCDGGQNPRPPRRLALAASSPALTYLDSAPIFGGERAAADAWAAGGGAPAADAARDAWADGERARRAELQGSGGLLEAKLAAVREGQACWVAEVPGGAGDGEEGGE